MAADGSTAGNGEPEGAGDATIFLNSPVDAAQEMQGRLPWRQRRQRRSVAVAEGRKSEADSGAVLGSDRAARGTAEAEIEKGRGRGGGELPCYARPCDNEMILTGEATASANLPLHILSSCGTSSHRPALSPPGPPWAQPSWEPQQAPPARPCSDPKIAH